MKLKGMKKKVMNYKKNTGKFHYIEFRRNKKINKNHFILESTHGDNVGGHNFYLIKEIQKEVKKPKIFIVSKNPETDKKFLENHGFENFTIVKHLSVQYYELLATCEYLINDTTFYPFFSKREGQKYIIIWHGTPLKKMGKDMPIITDVSNVQRNFYMADKIVVNNEYTKDVLVNSHNLANIYKGKVVVSPSPRNSIFFDVNKRKEIRKNLGIDNKNVVAYMPTWRGKVGKVKKVLHTEEVLKYLDKYLDKNTILYVKLHDFEKNAINTTFKNIRFFPEEYETYQFLASTDALITDYSSVMYDYLNSGKPIILYAYDLDDYIEERGMYEKIQDYPFEIARTTESLEYVINNIFNSNSNLENYNEMKKRFVSNDQIHGSNLVIRNILKNYIDNNINEYYIHNGKETVAILSGGFWNNGVTRALLNTLENIDTEKRNYICFFEKSKIKPEHYYKLRELPENVLFYPTTGEVNGNFSDRLLLKKYLWEENYIASHRKKQIRKIYREEFKRLFGDLKIDWFIHYTGFERKEAEMMRHIDSKKAIWVHTDMFAEYKAKSNYSKKIVFGAYADADKVVMVHDNLRENLIEGVNNIENKLTTVNNFLGEESTRNLSKENLFKSLENVKVDYSYNDNAYKTKNQMNLEELKSNIKNIVNNTKSKDKVDYKATMSQLISISNNYAINGYLNNIVKKELEMIDSAHDKIKKIFGENNEKLTYELLFNEFTDYIMPYLLDNEDELHYHFPELEEKINAFNKTIENKEELSEINQEKKIKKDNKVIIENYQMEKKENDLKNKFSYLFNNNINQVENYINNELLESPDQHTQYPLVDFYSHFRVSKIKLMEALFNPNIKVYINIGRYDYQKGHDKLIDAFEYVYETNSNIFLILVCPHGSLKSKTINRVRNSFARDNIVILGSMNNPYSLLKQSDAFVLSSNYEGLGLVVYEAIAVNTDVITVDLPETIQYLDNNQAIIVDNSVDGLIEGLTTHIDKKENIRKFDFHSIKIKSLNEFENVFK